MFELVMAAESEATAETAEADTAADDTAASDPTDIDAINQTDTDPDATDSNTNTNGDRDDLVDYLDSGKGEDLAAEAENWKDATVEQVADYLDSNKDSEYRQLFDRQGNEITAQQAKEAIGNDYFRAVIFNPEQNFSRAELHKLADQIIENKSIKAGQKIDAVYAVHQRIDGSNGHLHIVFHGEKQTLEKAGIDYKKMDQKQLAEWIVERSNIVNEIKPISQTEKLRNVERLENLYGKNRASGTEKIDNMIERFMGKNEHNMGNLSLKQIEKSLDHSLQKGRLSEKGKSYYLSRIEGRLNSLEKAGIAEKIDKSHWKFDREKWTNFQAELREQKQAKIDTKVAETIQKVEMRNYQKIDSEKIFEKEKARTYEEIKIDNYLNNREFKFYNNFFQENYPKFNQKLEQKEAKISFDFELKNSENLAVNNNLGGGKSEAEKELEKSERKRKKELEISL